MVDSGQHEKTQQAAKHCVFSCQSWPALQFFLVDPCSSLHLQHQVLKLWLNGTHCEKAPVNEHNHEGQTKQNQLYCVRPIDGQSHTEAAHRMADVVSNSTTLMKYSGVNSSDT